MEGLEIKRFMFMALVGLPLAISSLGTQLHAEVRFNNATRSDTLGQPVRYAINLPPGYNADDRSYPVLYLLHGGGSGQPRDWFTLAGLDKMLDRLIEDGTIRPLIAIAPDDRHDLNSP
jgi:enterochelin esterase-like enzyme